MNAIIPLLGILLVVAATGSPLLTPEPEQDPLAPGGQEQKLFITPAGRARTPMVPLAPKTRNRVCAKDYPAGFSVLCVVPYSPERVVFRVNGEYFRTERMAPYYLNGDTGGFVNKFDIGRSFSVGCSVNGINVWAVVVLRC